MTIWLASLHQEWADKIKSGSKTVELRKRVPHAMGYGDLIVFYTTKPVGKIELIVKIAPPKLLTMADLFKIERQHQVPADKLLKYIGGDCYKRDDTPQHLYGIKITKYMVVDCPLPVGITPPQGIVNIDNIKVGNLLYRLLKKQINWFNWK